MGDGMIRTDGKPRARRVRHRHQTMALVRLGAYPTAGMVDTGVKRTIIDRELAERAHAQPINRNTTMRTAGRVLRGRLVRINISVVHGPCGATVEALVPDEGEPFRKGLVLGLDFLRAAGVRIDTETGEVCCASDRTAGRRRRST